MVKEYEVKRIDIKQGTYEIVMNIEDAEDLALKPHDRVKVITREHEALTVAVNITDTMFKRGEMGAYIEVMDALKVQEGDRVEIFPVSKPESVEIIRKKMKGAVWTEADIRTIIKDISRGNLTHSELTAYVVTVQIMDLSIDEVVHLTKAMVDTGERIEFNRHPIFDIHSIGGVPGNKYAPLAVSIVAANGLLIPKTSSKAISSPSGTADFMEIITNVELTAKEIQRVAEKVGGTLVWGGGVNLAPADDIIIRAERPLALDPHSQVIASVIAKKVAAGVEKLLIDIPIGPETKVGSPEEARRLARDFMEVGRRVGIDVKVAVTYGGQPVGRSLGPALEIKEALSILEGAKGPTSTIVKAAELAGLVLEMGGAAAPGRGREMALETLRSGRALRKFREIIQAQGGNPDVKAEDIEPGKYHGDFPAPRGGYGESGHNRAITRIARTAGSPKDKGAGVYLFKKKGEIVEKGDALFRVYAEAKWKLEDALKLARTLMPITIEGMILEEVVE